MLTENLTIYIHQPKYICCPCAVQSSIYLTKKICLSVCIFLSVLLSDGLSVSLSGIQLSITEITASPDPVPNIIIMWCFFHSSAYQGWVILCVIQIRLFQEQDFIYRQWLLLNRYGWGSMSYHWRLLYRHTQYSKMRLSDAFSITWHATGITWVWDPRKVNLFLPHIESNISIPVKISGIALTW